MASGVGIVTDSVACLDDALADSLRIRVVPVHVLVGGNDHLDGELTHEQLHERIESGETATTATPSPGDFVAAYREMAAAGYEAIVVVTVSAPLSNVFNAARAGAGHAPVPVTVLDSRTVASAQGLVVRRIAELARAGASVAELEQAFEGVRRRTGLVATAPDLAHLARTGRVPNVVARVGDRLDVKPLIEIGDDGKAHPAGLSRSMTRASARMNARAVAAVSGRPARAVVMHTLASRTAEALATSLGAEAPLAEVEIAPFTAVMGIHTGPGLLGIAWQVHGHGADGD
jgi:DegV family protein with EDD domain